MKTTRRILTSIVGSLLLATATTIPAHAAPVPELPPYKCEPYSPAIRDYTCDANPDLLVTDSHDNLWIYPGDGDGGFLPRIKSGTGWHFTMIIASVTGPYDGVYARDKSGALWLYPSNNHGGWLNQERIGGGWNQMTSVIHSGTGLLAIDRSGTLWSYSVQYESGGTGRTWLPRQRVGHGWAGYMLVDMKQGTEFPDFYARDTHGTLCPYYFTPNGGARRGTPNLGTGWNRYTHIVQNGDFVNVDGFMDLIATDTHGDLWLYASESHYKTRVKIGHGWTGYTIY